jgi:LysM repeat protein
MKYLFCLALFAGILFGSTAVQAKVVSSIDSIGVERVGGKLFILHKVNPGQTMFAVVRQYGVTIHTLRDANPGVSDNIQAGQTLRVPYTAKAVAKTIEQPVVKELKSAAPPASTPSTPAANGKHRVEAGQTLYRVAVKYGVLMADLRKWNNLTEDNLKEGQELIVSDVATSKPAVVTPAPVPAPKVVTNVVKDSARAKAVVAEKVVKPVEEVVTPKLTKGKTKSETGLAEGITTDESTSKFLGLHRTAPIGSLVQVLNEYNQESIIVRIIGRIPNTSANDDIIIKLSSRAFEKVSPNSKRFRAIISYLE